jgi:hypothetical protein
LSKIRAPRAFLTIPAPGSRYEFLTYIGPADTSAHLQNDWTYWMQCDCGARKEISRNALLSRCPKSCGCKTRSFQRSTHKMSRPPTPTYTTWISMWQRCTNKNLRGYPQYGGRGITVCKRWKAFENFITDMGERPQGTTLDRFPDKNGNYDPSNCRWANATAQANNRRSNRNLTAFGRTQTVTEWAHEAGIKVDTFLKRLKRMPLDQAMKS